MEVLFALQRELWINHGFGGVSGIASQAPQEILHWNRRTVAYVPRPFTCYESHDDRWREAASLFVALDNLDHFAI